jgi:restriction system protein
MSLPDFQTLMLPVLKFSSTKEEHTLRDVVEYLKGEFNVSPEEDRALIPSGKQPIFYNRVGWARTYLKQAGLLESTRRNFLRITERGKSVLLENNDRIDMKYLERFPEYLEFKERTKTSEHVEEKEENISLTPEEILDAAFRRIRADLSQELLDSIKNSSPAFFERLVVELLLKMGYGGSGANAGRVVGKVGDEGIDGVIDEDKLGLDKIYIQAKKWADNPVGRPEIMKFVGALTGKNAHKGIFITASRFTADAVDYSSIIGTKVALIDGDRLTNLMIEYGVGVSTVNTFEVKRIDTDFFTENQ